MQTMVSASNAADMSSRPVSPTLDTVPAAINGPAMAPQLPPAAMLP